MLPAGRGGGGGTQCHFRGGAGKSRLGVARPPERERHGRTNGSANSVPDSGAPCPLPPSRGRRGSGIRCCWVLAGPVTRLGARGGGRFDSLPTVNLCRRCRLCEDREQIIVRSQRRVIQEAVVRRRRRLTPCLTASTAKPAPRVGRTAPPAKLRSGRLRPHLPLHEGASGEWVESGWRRCRPRLGAPCAHPVGPAVVSAHWLVGSRAPQRW